MVAMVPPSFLQIVPDKGYSLTPLMQREGVSKSWCSAVGAGVEGVGSFLSGRAVEDLLQHVEPQRTHGGKASEGVVVRTLVLRQGGQQAHLVIALVQVAEGSADG